MRLRASMSFSIAGISATLCTAIVLLALLGRSNGEELSHADRMYQPVDFQREFASPALKASKCRPNNDKNCYLVEALNYIAFGNKPMNPVVYDLFYTNKSDHQTLDDGLMLLVNIIAGAGGVPGFPKPGKPNAR